MSFEYELFKDMNNVRNNPNSYADKLLGYKSSYKANFVNNYDIAKIIAADTNFGRIEISSPTTGKNSSLYFTFFSIHIVVNSINTIKD